jgi:ribonuclease HI
MHEPTATFGTCTGYYCLFAKDGRYRQSTVDHEGQYGPNEAEYLTLIAVLNHIQERIGKAGRNTHDYSLTIFSHSELVIKQLRGEYKVKAPALQYRYVEATALLRVFKAAEFQWKHSREITRLFPDSL